MIPRLGPRLVLAHRGALVRRRLEHGSCRPPARCERLANAKPEQGVEGHRRVSDRKPAAGGHSARPRGARNDCPQRSRRAVQAGNQFRGCSLLFPEGQHAALAARNQIAIGHEGGDRAPAGQRRRIPPSRRSRLYEQALIARGPRATISQQADEAVDDARADSLAAQKPAPSSCGVDQPAGVNVGPATTPIELHSPCVATPLARAGHCASTDDRSRLLGRVRHESIEAGAVDVPTVEVILEDHGICDRYRPFP